MARVLLAWELGGGYGHVARLRLIAQALRDEGHNCVFAFSNLRPAQELLPDDAGPLLQAPMGRDSALRPVRAQLSYASLLHNVGCDDAVDLAARLRAWMELIRGVRADALLADHAPFALLAARLLDLPRATCGPGFAQPPPVQPFPAYAPQHGASDVLLRNERIVLGELNAALERLNASPLDHLSQIVDGAWPQLFTYSELDPYAAHRAQPWLGVPDQSHGDDPDWPAGDGPRVFAYLRNDNTLKPWLQALASLPVRALVRVVGRPVRVSCPTHVRVTADAVHTRRAVESCDLVVSYAPHSTVAEALLAGKPQVLAPPLVEQGLTAFAVQHLGAGVLARDPAPEARAQAVRDALNSGHLHTAAQDFRRRYGEHDRIRIAIDAVAALRRRWWPGCEA